MDFSLKLSGIIYCGSSNTKYFVTTGNDFPKDFSIEDMIDTIESLYNMSIVNKELDIHELSSKCEYEYKEGIKWISEIRDRNAFPLIRLFLNSHHKTKGRTYLILDSVEIAKVKILDTSSNHKKVKIVSKISKQELKDKLNAIHPRLLQFNF